MSATDTLRAMLDERGVEHFDGTEGTYWGGSAPARDGLGSVYRFSAREVVGWLNVHLLSVTPEQAIEATLGRGECHEVKIDRYWRGCGECGYIWEFMYGIGKCERPRYCPSCGRAVRA